MVQDFAFSALVEQHLYVRLSLHYMVCQMQQKSQLKIGTTGDISTLGGVTTNTQAHVETHQFLLSFSVNLWAVSFC